MNESTPSALHRRDMNSDPFRQFAAWYEAFRAGDHSTEPGTMHLATVSPDGRPSQRTVLLKAHDERNGFVFYTSQQSAKARDIAGNSYVSLLFFWVWLDRQIRIEGRAQSVSDADADTYFASRCRVSQIGAWASSQSRVLRSRAELDAQYAQYQTRFAGGDVPRPPHWGGYRVIPDRFEFWQGQRGRLHDRFTYRRHDGKTPDWIIERLAP